MEFIIPAEYYRICYPCKMNMGYMGVMYLGQKILAVVNPVSANGTTGKEWTNYEKKIKESGIDLDVEFTQYPLHAIEITRYALKSGYDTIVSVGGDGTMNEVLNGFFENGCIINDNSNLAIFSRGTGCDLVRTLGIGKEIEDIIRVLLDKKCIRCDVGKVNFIEYGGNNRLRYFLNVSDVGIGAETTYRVNRNSKALKGFLSFLLGALTAIIAYKNKKLRIIIDDNIIIENKINSVIIGNGRYFGGGMHTVPTAIIDDGLFDILVLDNLNKAELIMNFPKIYKGTHLTHPKVKNYRGKNIKIYSNEKVLIELDGEQPGIIDAQFDIIHKGINVLV